MKARADAEWFPAFVFDFSEGRGKERMEARANKERVNTTTWASLAMFTSNTRMLDYMTGVRQHSSEGELRRFLEWSPSKHLEFTPPEQALIKSLQSNYGVAGERYLKWLVTNRDKAEDLTRQVQEKIFNDFKATNDERFWIAGVSAVVAGAILAGRAYANVIDLPVKKIIECFFRMVEASRTAIRSSATSAEDIINDYIREFYGQFVIIKKAVTGSMLAASLGGISDMEDIKWTRTKIMGRVEFGFQPGWIEVFIEETLLRRHCSLFGYGYADFKNELSTKYRMKSCTKDLLLATKGPSLRVKVLQISMPFNEETPIADKLHVATRGSSNDA